MTDFRTQKLDELKSAYAKFFESNLNINEQTGLIGAKDIKTKHGEKRFATYAYVGSKYGEKIKILFIGLDQGKDELWEENKFHDFESRRKAVERVIKEKNHKKEQHNPHISGTMVLSGKILGINPKFKNFEEIDYSHDIIKRQDVIDLFEKDNPLSYVALTNFFKFVTREKSDMSAGKNRQHIYKEMEENLLIKEIEILEPEIVIFQSKSFNSKSDFLTRMKDRAYSIGYHPAFRHKKRTLKNLFNSYNSELNKILSKNYHGL